VQAQVFFCVIDLLDELIPLPVVQASFHCLQWVLASGGKDIWEQDEDSAEPLFSGEVKS